MTGIETRDGGDVADEQRRLADLHATGLLDTLPEPAFDRLTAIASDFLGVPVSLVSLVDRDRQFFKSQIGLPPPYAEARQTPLSHSFCQHVVATRAAMIVDDARTVDLVRDNLAIPDLGVIAYLGIPLRLAGGSVVGSFCAIDSKPRRWTDRERAILQDLAACAVAEISLRMEVIARREAEARLRVHERDLLRLNERLRLFASAASHDLQAPLRRISLFTELIEHDHGRDLSAGAADLLRKIRHQSQGARDLVHAFLNYARYAEAPTRAAEIELLPALECAVANTLSADAPTGTTIHLPASVPPIVADPILVTQIFQNLFSNAVKYAGERTPRIEVAAVAQPGEGDGPDMLVVAVTDNGIGIADQYRDAIFRPLYRLHGAEIRGFGLGLSLAADLAVALGGRLWLDASGPTGSCFKVALPLASQAVAPPPA